MMCKSTRQFLLQTILCLAVSSSSFQAQASDNAGLRFFEFKDQSLSKANDQRLASDCGLKGFSPWQADNKKFLQDAVQKLWQIDPQVVQLSARFVKVQLLVTAESIRKNSNQNIPVRSDPVAMASDHSIIFNKQYLDRKPHLNDICRLLAHELAHTIDVHDCISLSPEWMNSELPKLNKYKQLYHRTKPQNEAAADKLAERCGLPSEWAAMNLGEDLAENMGRKAERNWNSKLPLIASEKLLRHLIAKRTVSLEAEMKDCTLAEIAHLNGEKDKAVHYMDDALLRNPEVTTFRVKRVEYRDESGNRQDLIDMRYADKLLKEKKIPAWDAINFKVRYLLTRSLRQAKLYKEEKDVLEQDIKTWPEDDDVLFSLARNCVNRGSGNTSAALSYANRAVAANELHAENYRCRAGVYSAKEQYQKALADVTLVLLLEPDDEWALFQKAYCLYKLHSFPDAREVLIHLLKINPHSKNAESSLSWLDYEMGNYESCIKEVDTAMSFEPSNLTKATKAYALLKLKRYDEAEKIIQECLKEKLPTPGDTADCYSCLGEAQMGLKQKEEALRSLLEAQKLAPKNNYIDNLIVQAKKMK